MCELDFLFIHISCIHGIHFANKVAKSVEFSSILQCIEQSEQSNLDNNNNKKKSIQYCVYTYITHIMRNGSPGIISTGALNTHTHTHIRKRTHKLFDFLRVPSQSLSFEHVNIVKN